MTSENTPPIDDRTHDPGLHLFLDDHEVASATNLTPVNGRPRRRPGAGGASRPSLGGRPDKRLGHGAATPRGWHAAALVQHRLHGEGRADSRGRCATRSRATASRGRNPTWACGALGEHVATNIVLMVDGDVSHVYGGESRAGLTAERGGRYRRAGYAGDRGPHPLRQPQRRHRPGRTGSRAPLQAAHLCLAARREPSRARPADQPGRNTLDRSSHEGPGRDQRRDLPAPGRRQLPLAAHLPARTDQPARAARAHPRTSPPVRTSCTGAFRGSPSRWTRGTTTARPCRATS